MFHIVYQHSWSFNLETLLMLKIFSKYPPSWKTLSTIYQYSRWIDLIGNYHNFIFKWKISLLEEKKNYWQTLTNIRPEKCDFDQNKWFFMGKMVQIHQILERKKFKSLDFLQEVPVSRQEYKRSLVIFLVSYLACNENWLK